MRWASLLALLFASVLLIPSNAAAKVQALLVACTYENGNSVFKPLTHTKNDVELVRKVLKVENQNLTVLISGKGAPITSERLLNAIRAKSAACGPDDVLFIYFSGHGFNAANRGYLVTDEVGRAQPKLEDPSNQGYTSHSLIYNILKQSRARTQFLVMDACYSGTGKGAYFDEGINSTPGLYVLTSSTGTEQSYMTPDGHSIFTVALVQSLREDFETGEVDFKRLHSTVGDRMAELSDRHGQPRQTPCFFTPPPSDRNRPNRPTNSENSSLSEMFLSGGNIPNTLDFLTRPVVSISQIPTIQKGVGIIIKASDETSSERFRAYLAQKLENTADAIFGLERSLELRAIIALSSGLIDNKELNSEKLDGRYLVSGTIDYEVTTITRDSLQLYSVRVLPTIEVKDMTGRILKTIVGSSQNAKMVAVSSTRQKAIDMAFEKAADQMGDQLKDYLESIKANKP